LLSGAAALSFRKGSVRHGAAGNIFFVSMLTMAATAAYLGFMKNRMDNVFGGIFTIYMIATGWATVRKREGQTTKFDWAALLFGLSMGVALVAHGLRVVSGAIASSPGVPIGMPFFLGGLALLAAAGDIRMFIRGGVFGRQRVARHLWRMCFGLFVATGSFFLGQQQVFPVFLRGTNILFFLAILPLLLMIFWLIRIRFTKAYKRPSAKRSGTNDIGSSATEYA